MRRFIFCVAALIAAAVSPAFADDAPPFISGRPGNTESAVAVAPHRWQIESEAVSYARNDDGAAETESWSAASTALRYGVARGWDVEAIFTPYTRVQEKSGGARATTEGVSDLTVRVRRTFAGVDGEGVTFGVIGYVTAPTASDGLGADGVEGGVIAAGDIPLSEKWSATWTLSADVARADGGAVGAGAAGLALSYAASETIGLYAEAFSEYANGYDEATGLLQIGLTAGVSPETQIDVGAEFGVHGEADDLRLFIGWAHRF